MASLRQKTPRCGHPNCSRNWRAWQQLLKDIWGPTHTENSHYLRIVVGHLRQKLADDPTRPRFIVTEAGVGYRLLDAASFS